jgi:hypothetical protein
MSRIVEAYVPQTANVTAAENVAVYVRRGNLSPCNSPFSGRYLANSYFLSVLKGYVNTSSASVRIFSQSKSVEGWEDFSDYKLALNAPMKNVWQSIIAADVVVLFISRFSFVPALLKRHGRVIYTPNPQTPLHHWTTVDPRITQNSVVELERMKQSCAGYEVKKETKQAPPTPAQSTQETAFPEDDDAPRTVYSLARLDNTG